MYQLDYNRPEKEILIDLIRMDNGNKPLELDWVTISSPQSLTPSADTPRDTSVWVTGLPTSPLRGQKEYFYNRIPIVNFLYDGLVTPEQRIVHLTSESNSTDLSEWLSQTLGCLITSDMIQPTTLPSVNEGDLMDFTVVMKSTNLVIVGTLPIQLTR